MQKIKKSPLGAATPSGEQENNHLKDSTKPEKKQGRAIYDAKELAQRYQSGQSIRDLAAYYERTTKTIRLWLQQEGIIEKKVCKPIAPAWDANPTVLPKDALGPRIEDLRKKFRYRPGEKVVVKTRVFGTDKAQRKTGVIESVGPRVITVLLEKGYRVSVSLPGLHCGAEALERRSYRWAYQY